MPLNAQRARIIDNSIPCRVIPSNGGYTRVSCGRLFYSPNGHHTPADFPVSRFNEFNTSVTWGNGNIGWVHNPGGRQGPADFVRPSGGGFTQFDLIRVAPRRFAFFQLSVAQTGYGDCHIGIQFYEPLNANTASARWNLYHAAPGNIANDHSASNAGGGSFQMTHTGQCIFGMEIKETTREVRAWHDALNGDPRVDGLGGFYPAITTCGTDLFRLRIVSDNGDNGFEVSGAFGDCVVTKRRGILLQDLPAAGSVRISVSGVVQTFAAGAPYLNVAAGVVDWDAAPGIIFPATVRFEIFSGAALGGALVADLTIPKVLDAGLTYVIDGCFGGDVIGLA